MTSRDILLDLLQNYDRALHRTIQDLSLDALSWCPDAEANSIALTVWHVSRAFDVLSVHVLEKRPPEEELWHTRGWTAKTGYDPRGIGWDGVGNLAGYTQAEVAAVPILSASELLTYFDQASEVLRAHLSRMPLEDLQPPADGATEPEQPVYVWIRNFLMDAREHLGEIKAIKAMWERRMRAG
jgi:DinB family protein